MRRKCQASPCDIVGIGHALQQMTAQLDLLEKIEQRAVMLASAAASR